MQLIHARSSTLIHPSFPPAHQRHTHHARHVLVLLLFPPVPLFLAIFGQQVPFCGESSVSSHSPSLPLGYPASPLLHPMGLLSIQDDQVPILLPIAGDQRCNRPSSYPFHQMPFFPFPFLSLQICNYAHDRMLSRS